MRHPRFSLPLGDGCSIADFGQRRCYQRHTGPYAPHDTEMIWPTLGEVLRAFGGAGSVRASARPPLYRSPPSYLGRAWLARAGWLVAALSTVEAGAEAASSVSCTRQSSSRNEPNGRSAPPPSRLPGWPILAAAKHDRITVSRFAASFFWSPLQPILSAAARSLPPACEGGLRRRELPTPGAFQKRSL